MALDELAATIETIKQRIIDHRNSLAANETRTRQVLIDPLLAALGWDVTDPTSVELEYDVRSKRADYALLVDGNPVAVIEAKRLGKQLIDDDTMQVMNYANTAGIEYMVVTNGDDWNMYSVFQRGAIEHRLVIELRLSPNPSHISASNSLGMWRPNLAHGSVHTETNMPTKMVRLILTMMTMGQIHRPSSTKNGRVSRVSSSTPRMLIFLLRDLVGEKSKSTLGNSWE